MFDRLDFIYLPSRDVAADLEYYDALGNEVVFAIERFQTRVAMMRATADGPRLLLAEHLEGDSPILVFRVDDLDAAIEELRGRGIEPASPFEMPYGHGVQLKPPGPQRLAIYELTRPDRGEGLAGRRDF